MTDAQGAPATDSANPAQASAPAVAESVAKKWKVKVDGAEHEIDEHELVRGYQTTKSSQSRFQEAKRLSDQAHSLLGAFQKKDLETLRKSGIDPYKFAEDILIEKLEYDGLSDDAKARVAAEKERDVLKADVERREKEKAEAQRSELRTKAGQEIDQSIGDALKAAGRKPTPRYIARIAEQMLAHLQAGDGENLPDTASVMKRLDREYHDDISQYMSALPVEQLMEMLPKQVLDAIRQGFVGQLKHQDSFTRSREPKEAPPKSEGKHVRMKSEDFFKKMERKFGG